MAEATLFDDAIELEGVLQEKPNTAVSCSGGWEIVESSLGVASSDGLVACRLKKQIWNTSIRMVEEVEHLRTEIDGVALVDGEVTLNRDIVLENARSIARVAADCCVLGVFRTHVEVDLVERNNVTELVVRPG